MIESINIKGLLSFGWEGCEFKLKPLNVLIGPNGSGKSNLIEIIKILQSIPIGELKPFGKGGANEWIHKQENEADSVAAIEALVNIPSQTELSIALALQDRFSFTGPLYGY